MRYGPECEVCGRSRKHTWFLDKGRLTTHIAVICGQETALTQLSWLYGVLGLALLAMAPAVTAEPVSRLVDVRTAGAERVAALKSMRGVEWWLELGDHLLLTGERKELDRVAERTADAWPALDPAALVLEARGCGFDGTKHLPAIAEAGRFALVRVPPSLAKYPVPGRDWRPVQVNSSYARLWSNDPAKAAAGSAGPDPLVQPLVDAVNPSGWVSRFTTLAGYNRNTFGAGRVQARDWLVAQFQGIAGVDSVTVPSFSFSYSAQQYTAENVLARMPGTRRPNEWVIVGGHYDSRNPNNGPGGSNPSPGAEDNATGCAGVIEMARVLSRFRPERTVLFMCYAGEEQGLYGSSAHVAALQQAGDVARVVYMLNMDMIGYSGDADLDVLVESTSLGAASFARFGALAAMYAPSLRLVTSLSPCCSDHMPYLNAGIPGALTIANDWGSYPHYHQATDVPANVTNAQAMGGNLLRMNAAFLAETALASDRMFADGLE